MVGGGAASVPPILYDLTVPRIFPTIDKTLPGPLAVPEPTATLMFDTQKILVQPSGAEGPTFANARWSDTLPKLLQAKIIQSFENANFLGAVSKPMDGLTAKYQLLIDIRSFQVSMSVNPIADVEFTAKILTDQGQIAAARIFHTTAPTKAPDAAAAAAALNEAFNNAAVELVTWTSAIITKSNSENRGAEKKK
jgi:phospholipid/cholesterol/gamma-HCH transport system substrate-binding protein